MPLIEVVEGFWVAPKKVAAVKSTGIKECALFVTGQAAADGGFMLPYEAEDVAEEINDSLARDDYDEEDESAADGVSDEQ